MPASVLQVLSFAPAGIGSSTTGHCCMQLQTANLTGLLQARRSAGSLWRGAGSLWHGGGPGKPRRCLRNRDRCTLRNPPIQSLGNRSPDGKDSEESDPADVRRRLESAMASSSSTPLDGPELAELVFDKWGREFEVRIRTKNTIEVMWRSMDQRSFHLNREQYEAQLQAVAEVRVLVNVFLF